MRGLLTAVYLTALAVGVMMAMPYLLTRFVG